MFTQELGRQLLKSNWTPGPLTGTDQSKGIPAPPYEPAIPDETVLIKLPDPQSAELKTRDIFEVLATRESRRKLGGAMDMAQLSFLLWATQGIRKINGERVLRIAPSGGARHPFDPYVYADRVEGLPSGLYRYIATQNALLPVSDRPGLKEELNEALLKQWFGCAVALFWVYVPYRGEWRYTVRAHKVAAIDAGHICQNAYLAAEALGLGCCGIGAYMQEQADAALGLDGQEAFTCYAAVIGPYTP